MKGTLTLTRLGWFVTNASSPFASSPFGYPLYYPDLQTLSIRSDIKLDDRHGQIVDFVTIEVISPITTEPIVYASITKLYDDTIKFSLLTRLKNHLDSITPEEFDKSIDEFVEKYPSGPTIEEFICEMEDCPHCAYEEQQEYEAELEKDACIDFGNWLMFQNLTYVDNTDEGNIYMVESNMNRRMTMEQIYQLYLKEN